MASWQKRFLAVALAVLAVLAALAIERAVRTTASTRPVATLADGMAGRFRFMSYSARWSDLAPGAYLRAPVSVAAELFLPEGTREHLRSHEDRLPAVVILHGSDGLTDHQRRYARDLVALGLAVLVVDSFGARGVEDTIGELEAVTPYSMLIDAYRVLALLQTHPAIDPTRIALVGWSKGGMVADWASRRRYKELLGATLAPYAAYAAFYPWCGEQHAPVRLTGGPLLYLIGEKDDWTGTAPCMDYVERVRDAGYDARLVVFADAEHGFDYPGRFRRYLTAAEGWSRCNYVASETQLRVIATNTALSWPQFPDYIGSCTEKGAHVGSNARAREAAGRELRAFLADALKLPPPRGS
jgi:dienelactone hydrolase